MRLGSARAPARHYDRAMYGSTASHFHVHRRALSWNPFEGGPGRAVSVEATLTASPDEIWHAVTMPEPLAAWLGEVTGHLCEGGHFALEGNASGTIHACEPRSRILVDWDFGDNHSRIDVRISPKAGSTEVSITNSMPDPGSANATTTATNGSADADEHWRTYGPAAGGVGWESVLFALQHYLLTGERLDEESWVASPEGRAFIEESSKVWAEVHISTGAEESEARAAADRTRRFYLGES